MFLAVKCYGEWRGWNIFRSYSTLSVKTEPSKANSAASLFGPDKLMRHFIPKRCFTVTALTASLWLLAACGESALVETGGGAGDGDTATAQQAIALIQPFVGNYDLQDGWNGTLGDQAFLAIHEPNSDGVAEAVLIDFDDFDNCIPSRPSTGDITKDSFSNRIFLDRIFQFDQATLTLSNTTLFIEFVDIADIDGDGDKAESVRVEAERIAVTENDLGEPCV